MPSLLLLTLLYGLGVVLGTLLFIAPGVWLYVAWAFAMPALLVEGLRGRKALRALVRARQGTLVADVRDARRSASSSRRHLEDHAGDLPHRDRVRAREQDAACSCSARIAGIVGLAIGTPFQAALLTVLYFDLRVRKEGFDLELLAQGIGGSVPAVPVTSGPSPLLPSDRAATALAARSPAAGARSCAGDALWPSPRRPSAAAAAGLRGSPRPAPPGSERSAVAVAAGVRGSAAAAPPIRGRGGERSLDAAAAAIRAARRRRRRAAAAARGAARVRLRAAVLALALACACWPAAARGDEVSAAELRALAAAARDDRAALERLREVDVVDGRPAAIGEALRGSDADVRARLRRARAGRRPSPSRSPFAGAPASRRATCSPSAAFSRRRSRRRCAACASASATACAGSARPLEDAFRWVAGWLPGGPPLLWALLAGAVLAATAALAMRARRAGAACAGAAARARRRRRGERRSAAQLRPRGRARRARAATSTRALRLRFRAGLVELDSRELIELRPALTNRELLRDVPSPTLAGLVDGFEAVAYGGRPARGRRRAQRARRLAARPDEAGTR